MGTRRSHLWDSGLGTEPVVNVGFDGVCFGGKALKWEIDDQRFLSHVVIVEDSDVWLGEKGKPFRPMLEKTNKVPYLLKCNHVHIWNGVVFYLNPYKEKVV